MAEIQYSDSYEHILQSNWLLITLTESISGRVLEKLEHSWKEEEEVKLTFNLIG